MRILIVTEPGIDGVFRHVEGLVAELLRQGVTVHLAYSTRRAGSQLPGLVRRVEAAGGRTIDLRVTNRPEWRDVPALFGLARFAHETKPDVIHGHSTKAGALVRLLGALTFRGRRCFYTPHAYYGMTRDPDAGRVMLIYNTVERVLGRVGTTLNVSADEAVFGRAMLGVPPHRQFRVSNPVDATAFQPADAATRAAARVHFGLPANARLLGMVGRMCWQKDPETAYRAVALAMQRDPRLFFAHLGWGLWKDQLQDLVRQHGFADRFCFVDYQDEPVRFYHALDGLIVSSRYEGGGPFVVLEAMACNLPMIAAMCTGMSDLGRAGLSHLWTFASEDHVAAAARLAQWATDLDAPPRPCNHRAYVLANFEPARCYGEIRRIYDAVLRDGNPHPQPVASPAAPAAIRPPER